MSLKCLFCYTLLLHGYLPDSLLSHAVILFQMYNSSFLHKNANSSKNNSNSMNVGDKNCKNLFTKVSRELERREPHILPQGKMSLGSAHDKTNALNKITSCNNKNNSFNGKF